LVKYSFANGEAGPQEKIMDVVMQNPDDKTPRIRFDLGPNQVYRNRYVITAYGNVVDLDQKKILVDQHDRFVRASGDSLIFYTNDIFKGKYYSVLNLVTGKYEQVKDPLFRAITGKDVEPDCSQRIFRIYYYPPSAPKIELVRDAGYGEDISLIPGARPRLPLFWIDDDNFLYPNYSSAHDYVAIMKVSVSAKSEEKIGDVDQLPENRALSEFFRDADGQIEYRCSRGLYRVDVEKKKVTEMQFIPEGNGFSISSNDVDSKGRNIRSGETVIGNYYCDPSLASTGTGVIAFPYEMVLGGDHYLQGAAVWCASSSKWKTVGDSDLSAVVGWIEE
ncbi:MAG TPA: hypothetical protein VFU15_08570, partial [Bacteroidia bacterium]|nr:hypothetical protein [Bacteroidia bacterium]